MKIVRWIGAHKVLELGEWQNAVDASVESSIAYRGFLQLEYDVVKREKSALLDLTYLQWKANKDNAQPISCGRTWGSSLGVAVPGVFV